MVANENSYHEKPAKFSLMYALSILSNRNSLPNGIILKPDMNREERDADALLLKERWRLQGLTMIKLHI